MSLLLEADALTVEFTLRGAGVRRARRLRALDRVSLSMAAGERLGVVGESGCGKSTLARALLRLVELSGGRLSWQGSRYDSLAGAALRALRREMQLVFQDPVGSLDPRLTVAESVGEGLRVFEPALAEHAARDRIAAALLAVGLDASLAARRPHELSGGQCQRVAIARATILRPQLLVCDEATSALDVSVQAQIVNLLADLQATSGMAVLFISHNLAVVRQLCDTILVMYAGRVVERADGAQLCSTPLHPYSRALIAAVPRPEPDVSSVASSAVTAAVEFDAMHSAPGGCAYRLRCPHATRECAELTPELQPAGEGRWVACHRWQAISAASR